MTRPTRSFSAPSQVAADEAATPAAQMIVAAARRSSPIVTPSASQCVTGVPRRTSTPSLSSELVRGGAQHRRKGRQHARPGLDQDDARLARIDVAEVVAQRHARQLGDGAGHLDAGRAAADHDEGEEAAAGLVALGRLGVLERRQDAAADVRGVVDLLQAGRHALPFVVAEIGVPRAGREHQRVVGQGAIVERDRAALLVDAVHLAQQHVHVGRAAQDGADRRRDLGRRQAGGRDLVEQRLEQMVVAPVDDGDVGIGTGQRAGGAQPAEARADNDDVRPGHAVSPVPALRRRRCERSRRKGARACRRADRHAQLFSSERATPVALGVMSATGVARSNEAEASVRGD